MTRQPNKSRRWSPGATLTNKRKHRDRKRALEVADLTRSDADGGRPTPSPGRRRLALAGAVVVSIGAIFLLLGPSSFGIWSNQRSQTAALEAKIATLEDANDALTRRAEELRDLRTVEDIARSRYGMVPSGSKAYAILPSADESSDLGGTWPFVDLARVESAPPTTVP